MSDPKFRYYIVSAFTGSVTGTNDKQLAESFAPSEDDWVIDVVDNKHIHNSLGLSPEEDEITGAEIEEHIPYTEPTDEENQNGN